MPFLTALDVTLVDDNEDLWKLNLGLMYSSGDGRVFEVPMGFVCDFSSIPRLPILYWLFKTADTHRSGVLHDYLCRTGVVKRTMADKLFYDALRSDGVSFIKATMMWAAVRAYSGIVADS